MCGSVCVCVSMSVCVYGSLSVCVSMSVSLYVFLCICDNALTGGQAVTAPLKVASTRAAGKGKW